MLNNVIGVLGTPTPPVTNSYESIATVTVGAGGVSSISFSSIPSTYKHLQIRYIARSTNANSGAGLILININGQTGANYTGHYLTGNGSAAAAGAIQNYTSSTYFYDANGAALSNSFGAGVIDILDYADTNKYKTMRGLTGGDFNGSGTVALTSSAFYGNTNAISSIVIAADSNNLAQYSSFALYGIKG